MKELNPKDYILMENKDEEFNLAKKRALYNLDWKKQHYKLSEINTVMTTIRDLADLIIILDSKKRLYDGNGDLISSDGKKEILDDITKIGKLWRAEYLDNYFFKFNRIMYLASDHRIIDNEIKPLFVKEIKFIKKDGYIHIKYLDEDGLAKKFGKGKIYYYYPRPNSVARLGADSDWAILDCSRNPAISFAGLGVREKFLGRFNK